MNNRQTSNGVKILIEVSARHAHLSAKHLIELFGRGYQLTPIKYLTQKGEFAAKEKVAIEICRNVDMSKSRRMIKNLRIVGPIREKTQVEISRTDAIGLGINPPVRISKDLVGSPGAVLIGPKGRVKLNQGVIIARRHIHLDPKTAKKWGLKHKQLVSVRIGGQRALTFHRVLVRVKNDFRPAFHIDTDEANAAGLKGGEKGVIKKPVDI